MTRCATCPAEAHPPMVGQRPLCIKHKMSAGRPVVDSRGRRVGARATNGRLPAAVGHLIGTVSGTRTITGVTNKRNEQALVVACSCGSVTYRRPHEVRRGIGVCAACRGKGGEVSAKVFKQRATWREKVRRTAAANKAPVVYVPEVCNCTWFGGRLVHPCGRCAGERQAAG